MKFIAKRHIVTANGMVKPGGEIELTKAKAKPLLDAKWIEEPKKETKTEPGADNPDNIDNGEPENTGDDSDK